MLDLWHEDLRILHSQASLEGQLSNLLLPLSCAACKLPQSITDQRTCCCSKSNIYAVWHSLDACCIWSDSLLNSIGSDMGRCSYKLWCSYLQGTFPLHWPLINSNHMRTKFAKRELEKKRIEDDQRSAVCQILDNSGLTFCIMQLRIR